MELPSTAATLSEAVAYGEIGFSGTVPRDGAAAGETAALLAELREAGDRLKSIRQHGNT